MSIKILKISVFIVLLSVLPLWAQEDSTTVDKLTEPAGATTPKYDVKPIDAYGLQQKDFDKISKHLAENPVNVLVPTQNPQLEKITKNQRYLLAGWAFAIILLGFIMCRYFYIQLKLFKSGELFFLILGIFGGIAGIVLACAIIACMYLHLATAICSFIAGFIIVGFLPAQSDGIRVSLIGGRPKTTPEKITPPVKEPTVKAIKELQSVVQQENKQEKYVPLPVGDDNDDEDDDYLTEEEKQDLEPKDQFQDESKLLAEVEYDNSNYNKNNNPNDGSKLIL
ncbi:MAG: hypothetical protein JEZ07_14880 [Phycisphaerae bacterium]|nr:hypothetical protein [Phycisphaerae bacterium]